MHAQAHSVNQILPSRLGFLGIQTKGLADTHKHQGCGWILIWLIFSRTSLSKARGRRELSQHMHLEEGDGGGRPFLQR